MRDDTPVAKLPLPDATKAALKLCRLADSSMRRFETLGHLRTYWNRKNGRRGFLNLKDITIPMIDEIEALLKTN